MHSFYSSFWAEGKRDDCVLEDVSAFRRIAVSFLLKSARHSLRYAQRNYGLLRLLAFGVGFFFCCWSALRFFFFLTAVHQICIFCFLRGTVDNAVGAGLLCGEFMPHFRFEDLPNFRIDFFVQQGSTKSGSLPTSREKNSEKWWNWSKMSPLLCAFKSSVVHSLFLVDSCDNVLDYLS